MKEQNTTGRNFLWAFGVIVLNMVVAGATWLILAFMNAEFVFNGNVYYATGNPLGVISGMFLMYCGIDVVRIVIGWVKNDD